MKFKNYLVENPQLYNIIFSRNLFQVISGTLSITNGSRIYSQNSIVSSFLSTIDIIDAEIYNIQLDDIGIKAAVSTLTLNNTHIRNVTGSDNVYFIYSAFDSRVNMYNMVYEISIPPFYILINSVTVLDKVTVKNVNSYYAPIKLVDSSNVVIRNSEIQNVQAKNVSTPFMIISTNVTLIENTTLKLINQYPLYLSKSRVTMINGLKVLNNSFGISASESSVSLMTNSLLSELGAASVLKGGAIFMHDANLTITQTTFTSNSAADGGGIYFHCELNKVCNLTLQSCTFENNSAVTGGAISYDLYRPNMNNLSFVDNYADYGEDIASYAVRIHMQGLNESQIMLDDIISGKNISRNIVFELKDYDNQTMVLDNSSVVKILPTNNDVEVTNNLVKVNKGVATFDNLLFVAIPGSQNVKFTLNSNGIVLPKARKQLGSSYVLPNITVNFRYCKPGEYQATNV